MAGRSTTTGAGPRRTPCPRRPAGPCPSLVPDQTAGLLYCEAAMLRQGQHSASTHIAWAHGRNRHYCTLEPTSKSHRTLAVLTAGTVLYCRCWPGNIGQAASRCASSSAGANHTELCCASLLTALYCKHTNMPSALLYSTVNQYCSVLEGPAQAFPRKAVAWPLHSTSHGKTRKTVQYCTGCSGSLRTHRAAETGGLLCGVQRPQAHPSKVGRQPRG